MVHRASQAKAVEVCDVPKEVVSTAFQSTKEKDLHPCVVITCIQVTIVKVLCLCYSCIHRGIAGDRLLL